MKGKEERENSGKGMEAIYDDADLRFI